MPERDKPLKRVGRGNPIHCLHMPVGNGGMTTDARNLVWGARICRRLEVEYCVHSCDTSWNYITIGVFVAMTNFANGDFQIRRFPNCLQIRMLNQMSLGFCGDCRKSRYDSVRNPKKVAPIL
jgi:hypothetical protein